MRNSGMKNVLIIAPEFTPSSYPPALRARFFAQHLQEFGWNPIVLTTDARNYEATFDPENEKLLPPHLEVVRTRALPLKWTRRLGFSDISLRTFWPHWRAERYLPEQKSRSDPYFGAAEFFNCAGSSGAARFGIPYILDYNDPIITDHYSGLPQVNVHPNGASCAGCTAGWSLSP